MQSVNMQNVNMQSVNMQSVNMQSVIMLSGIMLRVTFPYCYAECTYAEWRGNLVLLLFCLTL